MSALSIPGLQNTLKQRSIISSLPFPRKYFFLFNPFNFRNCSFQLSLIRIGIPVQVSERIFVGIHKNTGLPLNSSLAHE